MDTLLLVIFLLCAVCVWLTSNNIHSFLLKKEWYNFLLSTIHSCKALVKKRILENILRGVKEQGIFSLERHPGYIDIQYLEDGDAKRLYRSEEHTSELQSPVPTSYAVFCLKKKNYNQNHHRQ